MGLNLSSHFIIEVIYLVSYSCQFTLHGLDQIYSTGVSPLEFSQQAWYDPLIPGDRNGKVTWSKLGYKDVPAIFGSIPYSKPISD